MKNRYKIILMCLFWSAVLGCVYLVGQHNAKKPSTSTIDRRELIEHVRYYCAEIEYFDSTSHSLKWYYSPIKENEELDGVSSFMQIDGQIIDSTSFLSDGRFSMNGNGSIADITIKNGNHYKISILLPGKCDNSKGKLDSVRKHFVDEYEEPDSDLPDFR